MSRAVELKVCAVCGGHIPAEAPKGLCPKCLLAQASIQTETFGRCLCEEPSRDDVAAAFPQLEILELIGRGGMGFVYKARQPRLDRLVALKILPRSLAADPAFAERFAREGRVLAKLNHPNIVTIHDFGQAGDFFYLLMEFVDGVNLREAMRAGRFSPAQALAMVPMICDALQFAHTEGILHRDIKPENILLDSKGRVKIADFGIAKLIGRPSGSVSGNGDANASLHVPGEAALTETGRIFGTPNYMAPEQVEHPQDVDQRADIYSLGVVFYEMLTGELPLGRFAPPSAKTPLDPRLDDVVLQTLEKERERRTGSAAEVKTQIESITESPRPNHASKNARPTRRVSARQRIMLAAAAAMLLLMAGVLWVYIGEPKFSREAGESKSSRSGSGEIAIQSIRNEVGRQLREAGATYDTLEVSIAIQRDSATPFRVRYTGLENLQMTGSSAVTSNGEFLMEYAGGGKWQGTLGGKLFAVQVGSRDKTDLPFISDPNLLGNWRTVDFVAAPADFDPKKPRFKRAFLFSDVEFLDGGETSLAWLSWTKGSIIHFGDETAARYEFRRIGAHTYLFFEWKSGDVIIAGRKPEYYVLQKAS